MNSPSALNMLVQLAADESSAEAKKLGAVMKYLEENQSKLAMLLSYRQDYAARLHSQMQNGLSASEHQNYQSFLSKLDQAIHGQHEIVESGKQQVEQQRLSLLKSERKKLSYGVLVNRSEKKQQVLESKKDQKAMDEHAMRLKKSNPR